MHTTRGKVSISIEPGGAMILPVKYGKVRQKARNGT